MITSNNTNIKKLLATYAFANDFDNLKLLISENDNINLNELIAWNSETECVVEESEIKENYDINSPFYYTTLLNLASIKGNVKIVGLLLENGALPTLRDSRGRTPFICCIYGSLDTLLVTPENYSKIVQISDNHLIIAKIFLKWLRNSGTENFNNIVNFPQNNSGLRGITPLCLASYLGKTKLVKILIEEGADVNGQDKNGATALMYAARDGHTSVVQVLMQYNASSEILDNSGWSAIQYGQNYTEVVKIIENYSIAEKGICSIFPQSLLYDISSRYPNFFINLSAFLRKHHMKNFPNMEFKDPISIIKNTSKSMSEGMSIHHYSILRAIKYKDLILLKNLLDGTSVKHVNYIDKSTGLNLLQYICRIRPFDNETYVSMIELLIKNGIDVNTKNVRCGRTALHYLCRDIFGNSDKANKNVSITNEHKNKILTYVIQTIKILIQNDIHIDSKDWNGNTALHYAVYLSEIDIVKVLVEDGKATIEIKNKKITYKYVDDS